MHRSVIRIRLIFLIVPLIIFAIALAGGHILVWRLFSLSLLVLLISYLWARLTIRGLYGQVKLPTGHSQAGESFQQEALVSNQSLLPKPLLKVWEDTNLPGYSNRLMVNLPPHGSHHWTTEIRCQRRGWYQLGSLTAEVTDPFGLFPVRRQLTEAQNLLVYPATIELPFFWLASYVESGSGRNCWGTTERNPVVSRVREYVPGDSLSRIHWRSTARAGKFIVKDFDLDLSKNIWVVVDMASIAGGDAAGAIEDCSVIVAASIVKKCVDSGRRIGLITQGDTYYLFPPQIGQSHLWRIMEALALVKATGEVPISQLIDREIARFRSNSVVVVVTASADELLVESLLRLDSRGIAPIAILVDRASFGIEGDHKNIAHRLTLSSIPTYLVKNGDDLASALDSRGIVPADERLFKVA